MPHTSGTSPAPKTLFALCFLALGFSCSYGWIVNGGLFADVATFAPFVRDIVMVLSAALFAVLAITANLFPHLLEKRLMTISSVGCLVSSAGIIPLALQAQNPGFTLAGLALLTFGGIWPLAMTLTAIVALPTPRERTVVVACAVLMSTLVRALAPTPSAMVGLAILIIAQAAILLLLGPATTPILTRVAKGAPVSNLLIEEPSAFLRPTHALFPCILLFCVASSYGSIFSESSTQPFFGFSAAVLVIAFCWAVFCTSKQREDVLFSAAVLLVIAGFMIVPFSSQLDYPLSGALLDSGGSCFTILFWLVLATIGSRNIYALIPTFAIANCMNYLGVAIGAGAGHVSASALDAHTAGAIALIAGFTFIAFLWLCFRTFSFSETIQGVTAVKPLVVNVPEDALELACGQLAQTFGLTEREREIFAMMAKGRNTRFIQEYLVISSNTVRSHIKHIYVKLDVHSQQELINLVEVQKPL